MRSLAALINAVIPHFDQFPLLSSKQRDFQFFKEVRHRLLNKEHETLIGFEYILSLAFKMNPSGKRKFTKKQLMETYVCR